MKTTWQNMTQEDYCKLRKIVLEVLRVTRKTTKRTWQVYRDDIVANTIGRTWIELARLGETIDLEAPSAKHLKTIHECAHRAVRSPLEFPDAKGLFSVREVAQALGVNTKTAQRWRTKYGTNAVDELVRELMVQN